MQYKENEDKRNKRIGVAVSVGVHSLLFLLFFFLIAWRLPDPPPPGLPGMEINIGFVDAGSGTVQTSEDPIEEVVPEEVIPEEIQEEAIVKEEVITPSTVESPHVVKEVKEKKVEPKKEAVEPVKELKKETVEAKNLFPTKTSNSDGNKDTKGDQGKPDGNPDSRNMFPGKGTTKGAGSSDGSGKLNLPGWAFDYIPTDPDLSVESGYVEFEFRINEEGVVEYAKKIGGANLTPSVDNFYKKKLMLSTFKPINSNAEPDKGQTGTLRINVLAR